MLMISLHNFVIRTLVLFGHDDWVALEDVQFVLELKEIALKEQVFECGDSLLSLLTIVLLGETKQLH